MAVLPLNNGITGSIPGPGCLMNIHQVLAAIPVSRSTWYNGIKKGKFPPPVKVSNRMNLWKAEDIQGLIYRLIFQEEGK